MKLGTQNMCSEVVLRVSFTTLKRACDERLVSSDERQGLRNQAEQTTEKELKQQDRANTESRDSFSKTTRAGDETVRETG